MIYKMFKQAMDCGIVKAAASMPKNLRQHYADMMMYIRVCIEYGIKEA